MGKDWKPHLLVNATVLRDALCLTPSGTPNKKIFCIKVCILIVMRFNCAHMLTTCRKEINLTLWRGPTRKCKWSITSTLPYVFTIRCLRTGTKFLSRHKTSSRTIRYFWNEKRGWKHGFSPMRSFCALLANTNCTFRNPTSASAMYLFASPHMLVYLPVTWNAV
jgi:hypothetical protein